MVAHLEHTGPIIVAVAPAVDMHACVYATLLVKCTKKTHAALDIVYSAWLSYSVSRELTFAGLQAFDPRVLGIALVSTVVEPSAIGSAATEFARFFDGSTLGAYGTNSRNWCYYHRSCWDWTCEHRIKKTKRHN